MVGKFGTNMDIGGGTPGRTILTKVMCTCPLVDGPCRTMMEMWKRGVSL